MVDYYVVIVIDEKTSERKRHAKVELLWEARAFLTTLNRTAINKKVTKLVMLAVKELHADPDLIYETIKTPGLDMSPMVEKLESGTRYRFTLVNGSEPLKKLLGVLNNSKPRKEVAR